MIDEKIDENDRLEAAEFAAGLRGQYIISQALSLAVKVLKKREESGSPLAEPSNRSDMEYLRDKVFPLYHVADLARTQLLGEFDGPNSELLASMMSNLVTEEDIQQELDLDDRVEEVPEGNFVPGEVITAMIKDRKENND